MPSSFMASMAHYLPSLFFINLLFTYINATCPPFDCGNGVTIGYPFWHQSQMFQHCGYPGFNLSCNNKNPTTLYLSNTFYSVKAINYSDHTLTLNYLEVKDTNCPRIPHDVNLSTSSLLNYTLGNTMLRFFYNCTLYPPSHPPITCLDYGAKRSFVFMVGAEPEFDWHAYCESIITVPVIAKEVDGVLARGLIGEALRDGFKLTWKSDGACESCEASGGFCRVSSRQHQDFSCICNDGQDSIKCRVKGNCSYYFICILKKIKKIKT